MKAVMETRPLCPHSEGLATQDYMQSVSEEFVFAYFLEFLSPFLLFANFFIKNPVISKRIHAKWNFS